MKHFEKQLANALKIQGFIGSFGEERHLWCWRALGNVSFRKFFYPLFVVKSKFNKAIMKQENRDYKLYKHEFPNGKVYIGITSMRTWERWCGGHGYDGQPLMRNAIKKYGWKNINHSIIADGLTKCEAETMEIELIKKYKSTDRRYGYNVSNGGNSAGKFTDETRRKMSENQMGEKNTFYGKHLTEEHKSKIRERRKELGYEPINKQPVLCVETGVIFESTAEATRVTGIHNYAIRRVCYGERKTAGGYHWQYIS